MLEDPIGRLRAVGLLEGTSFLLLLGVAMPLKYLADLPVAVKIVGWIHGLLFLLFCVVLIQAHQSRGWSAKRSGLLLVAALLPFGPFVADRGLRSEIERPQ